MSELPNIQQNNEQILNDIQSLQQMEQQIFNNLETNPNLNSEQQQNLIEKMNQLSNMRINLYNTLSGVNNYYQSALNSSVGTLQEQTVAIGIVESELNKSKQRLQQLEEEKNNKIRLVEINSYYGDKYDEHSQLMKIIIYTLIPVIIIAFLYNANILPRTLYYILILIISLVGAYYFWRRYASIIMRDNMEYQQYDWGFNPDDALTSGKKESSNSSNSDPWQSTLNLGTCVGDSCCSNGLVYDTSSNQCVVGPTTTTSSTETFSLFKEGFLDNKNKNNKDSNIHKVLTKTQQGKFKTDYDMKQPEAFNLIK